MGHRINAIITRDTIDQRKADEYELPVFHEGDFTIIGLDAAHSDHWTQELSMEYGRDYGEQIINIPVTLHFAYEMRIKKFALVHTDYFGGIGDQHAAVYENGKMIIGGKDVWINDALREIGVVKKEGMDEFDTISLGDYRNFDTYFEKYYD
jgi:hypothetical protein